MSVQQVIEDKLCTMFGASIQIVGSGRTDTGVHARQQIFHADFSEKLHVGDIRAKLNSFLPQNISINSIRQVKDDAHARFDATERSYEYLITQRKDPFLEKFAYRHLQQMSLDRLNATSKFLLGNQDFESFSKVKTDVNSFLCTLTRASWRNDGNKIIFNVSANRFLRGMVRALVGTIIDVGIGRIEIGEIKIILDSHDRKRAGRSVPAKGLYLTEVRYPEEIYND